MNPEHRSPYEIRLLILKFSMMTLHFCTFFLMLSFNNPQILRLSRTAGITMMTYAILLPVISTAYRSFEIGRKEKMHLINTSAASVWITDFVTYFQLLIMNFNEDNRSSLMPVAGDVVYLLIAMVIQLGLVLLFISLAIQLYLKNNPPRRSCLICSSKEDARLIYSKLSRFGQRYQLERTFFYHHDNLIEEIPKYDQVFLYNIPFQERQALIEYCYKLAKPVSYNMEIADIIGYGAGHDMFDDISFISADNRRSLTIEQRVLKRTLDLVGSSLMLLCASPIMLLCAAAIWLYDRESVFFCQPRATIGGRVFTIYKFRTMRTDADDNRSVLQDDDRITPVGKVLRRLRLDELPQLINILKGDMSLVGPRPEMLSNVKSYTEAMPEFSYRLAVKAGLTGYAQIAGKYNTAPKEKMLMDLMYIEDYSILRDVKLILKTVTVFFRKDSTDGFHTASSNSDDSIDALFEEKPVDKRLE